MIPETELTVDEQKVLAAFRAGDKDVDVARAEIRGDFLRGLFLGDYDEKADYRGTYIVGAIVSDVLDMGFCETKFPMRFLDCCFEKEIRLQQLTCSELDFSGCVIQNIFDARMVNVAGSVNLTKVNASALVGLSSADVGGQLVCKEVKVQDEGGERLSCCGH